MARARAPAVDRMLIVPVDLVKLLFGAPKGYGRGSFSWPDQRPETVAPRPAASTSPKLSGNNV